MLPACNSLAWIGTGECMSDLVYLLIGVAVFVVFAGYAALLRRA